MRHFLREIRFNSLDGFPKRFLLIFPHFIPFLSSLSATFVPTLTNILGYDKIVDELVIRALLNLNV